MIGYKFCDILWGIVQLSCNDLEDRLFEGYKENSIEFSDWLLNYLYSFTICLHLHWSNLQLSKRLVVQLPSILSYL